MLTAVIFPIQFFFNNLNGFVFFEVERQAGFTEESLLGADRRMSASVTVEPSCAPGDTYTRSTGTDTLPLREPEPVITKQGRNLDAEQGRYSDPVYGHEGDNLIWRIRVRNNGDAPLQDFVFDDAITGTNFEILHVCDNESDAEIAAAGGPLNGCDLIGPTTSIAGVDVASRFGPGTPANPYIAAERGYVDRVILPHETRLQLVRALRALRGKRASGPPKKHGNIPL